MAARKSNRLLETAAASTPSEYTVVARRYRPRQFQELIGQEHVATALINALKSNRVAHAYLFTGARGVGKTSAARILAKALNCESGPTPTPCDHCESCLAIAEGQDVDVVEIDGASNNRIDEARDLRQNIGFRPTRSRYKIYIIDEVHMLTTQAFNALLKTLEEPPPHVKFIFATTEVQKIPITILSRCQRFDFAHVGHGKIYEQLKSIVQREGHEADDDALRLIARRAAGSMRDSQSLLDQLLGSATERLTLHHVQEVLGTSSDERVAELASAMLSHDVPAALTMLGTWCERGLQVGELVDQLIDYWRGLMLINCAPDLTNVPVAPNLREVLIMQAASLTTDAILAGLDILTTTKSRMRGNSQTQVLLEMAVVRLSRIGDLISIAELSQRISNNGVVVTSSGTEQTRAGTSRVLESPVRISDASADQSKKNGSRDIIDKLKTTRSDTANFPLELNQVTLPSIWESVIQHLSERSLFLATHLRSCEMPAIIGPNLLVIRIGSRYIQAYESINTDPSLARIKEAFQKIAGLNVAVKLELRADAAHDSQPRSGSVSQAADRRKQLMQLPLLKKVSESLGAQLWHVDETFNPLQPHGEAASDKAGVVDDESAIASHTDED